MKLVGFLACLGSVAFADRCPDVAKIRAEFFSSGKGKLILSDVRLSAPHPQLTPEIASNLVSSKFFFEQNMIVSQNGCQWIRKRLLGPKFLIRDYTEDRLEIVIDEADARRAIKRKYDMIAAAVQLVAPDAKPSSVPKAPVRQRPADIPDAIAEVMVAGLMEAFKRSLTEAANDPALRRQLIDQALEKEMRVLKDSEYTLVRQTDQRYELTYQSVAQDGEKEIPFEAVYSLSWDGLPPTISPAAAKVSEIAQRYSKAPR